MTSPVSPIKSVSITTPDPETKSSASERVIRTFVIDGKNFKATFTFSKKQNSQEREAAIKSLMPHITECTKLFKIGKADSKDRTTSKLVINTESGDKTKYTYIRMFSIKGKEAQKEYNSTRVAQRLQKISSSVLPTKSRSVTSLSSRASAHSSSSPSTAQLSGKTTETKEMRRTPSATASIADEIHSMTNHGIEKTNEIKAALTKDKQPSESKLPKSSNDD